MSESINETAHRLVNGDRGQDYGPPSQDAERVVGALNAFGFRGPNGRMLAPHDWAVIMACVKLSRIMVSPTKRDHWVDLAGYSDCGWQCVKPADEDARDKVYIAGPMRGRQFYNFAAFFAAELMLLERGYAVVNPAGMDMRAGFDPWKLPANHDWRSDPPGFDMRSARKRDIEAIQACDGIYLLRGWENSTGANAEKALAEWCGLEVVYEETSTSDDSPRISETQRAVAFEEPFDGDPDC